MPSGKFSARKLSAPEESRGKRLDAFLAEALGVSRSRVQRLIERGGVSVDGRPGSASRKLRGGESIEVAAAPEAPLARAYPENIPLEIVFEDEDLAVVVKPSGMTVHAGAGATEEARTGHTLVNALLHHFTELSSQGGALRPGIVHRLDKQTSGLTIVARNDEIHAKLAAMFARREVRKTYLALVHGFVEPDAGTLNAPISRDRIRRIRMTARAEGGRFAVTHWRVLRRIDGPYGKFSLLSVRIETGRTHQIRVHLSTMGRPIAGDTLYGASARLRPLPSGRPAPGEALPAIALTRNFLHAAELEFHHPRSGKILRLRSSLPLELREFLEKISVGKPSPPVVDASVDFTMDLTKDDELGL